MQELASAQACVLQLMAGAPQAVLYSGTCLKEPQLQHPFELQDCTRTRLRTGPNHGLKLAKLGPEFIDLAEKGACLKPCGRTTCKASRLRVFAKH